MLRIAWRPEYIQPLPEGHRFPMEKYALLPEQLLYEGTIGPENIFTPELIDEKWILKTHAPSYLKKLNELNLAASEERKTGFPLDALLVAREKYIMEGTRMAADFALQHGISMNIAGGTHHAFYDRGEGFCLLNDQAIAANYLLKEGKSKKILIIDLDVHQGNGTAALFEKEDRVFTFSMHGEHNYPLQKEKSNLDIPLKDKIEDTEYLSLLLENLPRILDDFQPDFAFYQCGVDILETDKLGRLKVTKEGCRKRDEFVLKICKTNQIPLMASMGGGYSEKISDIVEAHANTFRLAQEIYF